MSEKKLTRLLTEHAKFFVILASAAAMNAFLLYRFPNVGGDTLAFLLPIHHWAAGDGYSLGGKPELLFSPGYGILSGLVYGVVRDIEYSGMLVCGLSYVGMVIVAYTGVGRFLDREAAVTAALFVALSPALVAMSYISLADLPAAFFIVSGAFMTLRALVVTCSPSWYAALGVVMGFGTLIRPDCLIVAGGAILLIAIATLIRIRRNELAMATGAFSIMLFIIGFLVCIGPYMNFLHQHTGKWTISNKFALVVGGGSEISNVPIAASLFGTLKSEMLNNLTAITSRIKENAMLCLYSFVVCNFYCAIPILLVWLAHPFLARRLFRETVGDLRFFSWGAAVLLVFLTPLIPYLLYAKDDRRWIPYWTLVVIAGGIFIYLLLRCMVNESDKRAWLFAQLLLVTLCVLSPHIPVPSFLRPRSLYGSLTAGHAHYGLRDAGFWLRDNTLLADRLKILSRKPSVVVFYAFNKKIAPSYGSGIDKDQGLMQNLSKIHELDLKYMILDAHYIKEMPSFRTLWTDPDSAKNHGLRLVAGGPNMSFKVFERENR